MQTPAVLGSLGIPPSAVLSTPTLVSSFADQQVQATLEAILPEGILLRLPDGKQLQTQGSLPFPVGSTLTLTGVALPDGAGVRLQVIRATPPPSPPLLAPLTFGEAAPLMARLQSSATQSPLAELLRSFLQAGAAIAEQPETWSTWVKEAMKTLSNPAASPAEAAFHQLQAKEGTALFEVPLPWAPGTDPMRIWIEGEKDPSGSPADQAHRVFLSVPFTNLGEVRMGLEQRSAGLKVRLWLQNPSQIADLQSDLESELTSLGRPVHLQVLALPPGSPDIRALAGVGALQAMG